VNLKDTERTDDPSMQWSFGQITDTKGGGDQAETVTPRDTKPPEKMASIGMTKDCFARQPQDVLDWLEPTPPFTASGEHKLEHDSRMSRFVWVHEIGHTLWAEFDRTTITTWTNARHGEAGPTEYARRRDGNGSPIPEEDFCESFAIYALYGGKLAEKCPQRWKWFDIRKDLLKLGRLESRLGSPRGGGGAPDPRAAQSPAPKPPSALVGKT
jgi:hypothetical protein